jgi:hypothetical protein
MSIYIHNCPFCESDKIGIKNYGSEFYVFCIECRSDGPLHEDITGAITAWNKAPRNFETTLSTRERAA